jgi:hypothetical protein
LYQTTIISASTWFYKICPIETEKEGLKRMKKVVLIVGILIALLLCGIVSAELGADRKEYDPTSVSVKSLGVQVVQQQQVSCKILWDTYHGDPPGNDVAFQTYTELVSDLQNKGCSITASDTGILATDLSQYDVLIISAGTSISSGYTAAEVDDVQAFVNNGGGLLVLNEWYDYVGQPHIDLVVQRFGINTIGYTAWDTVTNLDTTHPIFSGVSSLYIVAAGTMNVQSPSTAVAWYGQDAVVSVVPGKKVVIIGDSNLFQTNADPTLDFINQYDNRKFASNVFTYLCPKENQMIPGIPEFPSPALPAVTIIGFVGAALLIQRTREH